MTDVLHPELGNTKALTHMIESMRKGKREVLLGGNPIHVGRKLGEGGTKTVFEAAIGRDMFALAFPNTIDGVEVMKQKWQVALKEPDNTARIREMNLFTNSVCEALAVQVNGVPFTVLLSTRYQDLPYQIMDGKNSASSTVTGSVLPENPDESSFIAFVSPIIPDIQTLLHNGVRVGGDSINVCLVDGKPRIFLSDLGSAEFEAFSDEELPYMAEGYVRNALGTFKNGLRAEEYQKHKDFFKSVSFKITNPQNVTMQVSQMILKSIMS